MRGPRNIEEALGLAMLLALAVLTVTLLLRKL